MSRYISQPTDLLPQEKTVDYKKFVLKINDDILLTCLCSLSLHENRYKFLVKLELI